MRADATSNIPKISPPRIASALLLASAISIMTPELEQITSKRSYGSNRFHNTMPAKATRATRHSRYTENSLISVVS